MPEMDGLAATRNIRETENSLGLRRTTIVAVAMARTPGANSAPSLKSLMFFQVGKDDWIWRTIVPT